MCFIVLVGRRCILGGELGGKMVTKYATGCFLFFLWVVYIVLSTLQAYKVLVIKL
jgi:solute carrier family 8 (sodium/calcium exchanger)